MNNIDLTQYSVNSLMELRNRITSRIEVIQKSITDSNVETLLFETRNLLNHVGSGYVEEDYYASARYYSEIPGVKNIRVYSYADPDKNEKGCIGLKILSPKGKLVPSEINIDGSIYTIEFWKSKNYSPWIDY